MTLTKEMARAHVDLWADEKRRADTAEQALREISRLCLFDPGGDWATDTGNADDANLQGYTQGLWRCAELARHGLAKIERPALSQFTAPAGWKLVPEEPTKAMLEEFPFVPCGIHCVAESGGDDPCEAYRAMLAVAPQPKRD